MTRWMPAQRSGEDGRTLNAEVPPESVLFVDAAGAGATCWGRLFPAGEDAPRRAAAEWWATAERAAGEASRGAVRGVRVLGEGALARLVTRALPPDLVRAEGEDADVVVDTTGDPAVIGAALMDAPRLGAVLLAAPPVEAEIAVRTYTDIHVRGLTVAGIPWAAGAEPGGADADGPAWALDSLTTSPPGRPVDPAPWYGLVPS
ncbi:hypothetical protein ACFU5Z_00290 [Streptomyces sp. NPDC057521]|uniref:hypothetical protein n=1 Tax=Streptomyces sp. NPDC057521 TaxID=3346156 RepID=UPI003684AE84